MKSAAISVMLCTALLAPASWGQANPRSGCCPEQATREKQQALWQKMVSSIQEIDQHLNGVMGVAVLDLTDGQEYMLRGDELFPQASSIKIAVLAELYHEEQQAQSGVAGKQRLNDVYTVRSEDMVPDSDIMLGLTPGVTRVTNRDLATMMVAVSDNSATNVLIDRLGMENVNALLRNVGLRQTKLQRKMMDLKAASQGRENIATPREMMTLLAQIYRGKLFAKALSDDFFKMLSTGSDDVNTKRSMFLPGLPPGVNVSDKPGRLEGVRANSGVIVAAGRPFVLSVMTTYDSDEQEAEKAIQNVTAAAFPYFDMVGRASEYGRVISPRNGR